MFIVIITSLHYSSLDFSPEKYLVKNDKQTAPSLERRSNRDTTTSTTTTSTTTTTPTTPPNKAAADETRTIPPKDEPSTPIKIDTAGGYEAGRPGSSRTRHESTSFMQVIEESREYLAKSPPEQVLRTIDPAMDNPNEQVTTPSARRRSWTGRE